MTYTPLGQFKQSSLLWQENDQNLVTTYNTGPQYVLLQPQIQFTETG